MVLPLNYRSNNFIDQLVLFIINITKSLSMLSSITNHKKNKKIASCFSCLQQLSNKNVAKLLTTLCQRNIKNNSYTRDFIKTVLSY